MSDLIANSKKILILASASTGNNIFCTPAIRLMRKHLPDATIEVVAPNKLSAQVFANNPDINALHITDSSKKFDRLARDMDAVIVLNKNTLKKLKEIQTPYLMVPTLVDSIHHADQLLNFVSNSLGVVTDEADRAYVLRTSVSWNQVLGDRVSNEDKVIAIHLGCGTTVLHGWKFFYTRRADDKKLWSIDDYILLGQGLHNAVPNLKIVITGTANEGFLAKKFVKKVPGTINLVGKTLVSDLVALMQRVNLFIAHDCGVLHVAAASDVPIVALFGPTNSVLTGPYPSRPQHRVIKKNLMTEIEPQEVITSAIELLGQYSKKDIH